MHQNEEEFCFYKQFALQQTTQEIETVASCKH
jgi:hypothetical protein